MVDIVQKVCDDSFGGLNYNGCILTSLTLALTTCFQIYLVLHFNLFFYVRNDQQQTTYTSLIRIILYTYDSL